jgi:DNA-binding NtrC family response regulator
VFPIQVPPLRERLEDVADLAEHFIKQSAQRLGVHRPPRLTRSQIEELQGYSWPGNVRELQNVIERAVILARGGVLRFELPHDRPNGHAHVRILPPMTGELKEDRLSLDELEVREREIVSTALRRTNWKVYGKDGAS